MPAIARVIETQFMGDGTIENLVRVDSITESMAIRKARRASLRNNGYSYEVLRSPSRNIQVEVDEVADIGVLGGRRRFIVKVITTGVGSYSRE